MTAPRFTNAKTVWAYRPRPLGVGVRMRISTGSQKDNRLQSKRVHTVRGSVSVVMVLESTKFARSRS